MHIKKYLGQLRHSDHRLSWSIHERYGSRCI